MSYELIIYQNPPRKSGLSKSSKIPSLRDGKMMGKKILNMEESKSEGVIKFGSSI